VGREGAFFLTQKKGGLGPCPRSPTVIVFVDVRGKTLGMCLVFVSKCELVVIQCMLLKY